MFNIIFYNMTGEKTLLDKTKVLKNATTISGELKTSSSMITPSIIIEKQAVPTWNYCFISSFNRYYFIREITSVNNRLWQIDMTVDVLMTYKDEIRGINARALYSFSGREDMIDPRLKAYSVRSVDDYSFSNILTRYVNIVAVVGGFNQLYGGTKTETCKYTSYIISEYQFGRFLKNLAALSDTDRAAIQQTIISVSAVEYIPANLPQIKDNGFLEFSPAGTKDASGIKSVSINFSGTNPENFYAIFSETEESALNPIKFTVNENTLLSAPIYAVYKFKIPFVGEISFSPAELGTEVVSSIGVNVYPEFFGGTYTIIPTINGAEQTAFSKTFPNVKTFPIVKDTNIQNWFSTALKAGISATAAGITGGLAGAAISVVGSAVNAIDIVKRDSIGYAVTNSNGIGHPDYTILNNKWILSVTYPNFIDQTLYQSEYGYPDGVFYNGLNQIADGYAQFDDFHLTGFSSATSVEIDQIEQLLKEGIILS